MVIKKKVGNELKVFNAVGLDEKDVKSYDIKNNTVVIILKDSTKAEFDLCDGTVQFAKINS